MSMKKAVAVEESQKVSRATITNKFAKIISFGLNLAILFMYFSLLFMQLVGCILVGLKLGGVIAISWQLATLPFMITAFSFVTVIAIYMLNEHCRCKLNCRR